MNLSEQLVGADFFREEVLVGGDGRDGCIVGFIEKFDAELAQAGGEELLEKACAGLGTTVEQGIAAADIGLEAVELSDAIF